MARRAEEVVVLLDDDDVQGPRAGAAAAQPRKRKRDDAASPAGGGVVDLCDSDDDAAHAARGGARQAARRVRVDLTGSDDASDDDEVTVTAVVHRAPPPAARADAPAAAMLRLVAPWTLPYGYGGRRDGRTGASAVVHMKDLFRDRGFGLMQLLQSTMHPGWLGGGAGGGASQLAVPNTADVKARLRGVGNCVLRCAAAAVRSHAAAPPRGPGPLAPVSAADAAAASRRLAQHHPFMQFTGLRYGNGATLYDHVDGHGRYLVLLSLGCTVQFLVDGNLIEFESGDALVFHGGRHHRVMHGVRAVRPGTCPACMPRELRDARVSLQLRQL